MVKIFLTVRNRLEITKKCIEALNKHSKIKHHIYVYDNDSNYLLDEHFSYFCEMYKKGIVEQVTFTKTTTTFNAFSKASTCNFFGRQHEEDPQKDSYDFLLFLDNDIIVTPEWDKKLNAAWRYVKAKKMNNIKVIGQRPGGIKNIDKEAHEIEGMTAKVGTLGGSGMWSVRPNFFRDVGFLDLRRLVGHDKKHDQMYWQLMSTASGNKKYIMGLNEKLGIHCGREAGSVCNVLTKNRGAKDKCNRIKFEEKDRRIGSYDFDTFFKEISNNQNLLRDW